MSAVGQALGKIAVEPPAPATAPEGPGSRPCRVHNITTSRSNRFICCFLRVGYCRPHRSNDRPIPPASGLYFQRQNHSLYRLGVLSSIWSTNGGHTFRLRTRQRCRGMYGGPHVLERLPAPRRRDNLLRWRFGLLVNKSQHRPIRNVSWRIPFS